MRTQVPAKLQTDNGLEFCGKEVKELLAERCVWLLFWLCVDACRLCVPLPGSWPPPDTLPGTACPAPSAHTLVLLLTTACPHPCPSYLPPRVGNPLRTSSDRFVWDHWHVPGQYNLLRTPASAFFPPELYDRWAPHT